MSKPKKENPYTSFFHWRFQWTLQVLVAKWWQWRMVGISLHQSSYIDLDITNQPNLAINSRIIYCKVNYNRPQPPFEGILRQTFTEQTHLSSEGAAQFSGSVNLWTVDPQNVGTVAISSNFNNWKTRNFILNGMIPWQLNESRISTESPDNHWIYVIMKGTAIDYTEGWMIRTWIARPTASAMNWQHRFNR